MKNKKRYAPRQQSGRQPRFPTGLSFMKLAIATAVVSPAPAHAARIRYCQGELELTARVTAAPGTSYDGPSSVALPSLPGIESVGRHGGVQIREAKRRARERLKTCFASWAGFAKSSATIAECDNSQVEGGGLQHLDFETKTQGTTRRRYIGQKLCADIGVGDYGPVNIKVDLKMKMSGDHQCTSTANPEQTLDIGDYYTFCRNYGSGQFGRDTDWDGIPDAWADAAFPEAYGIRKASTSPRSSRSSAHVAMMNALSRYIDVLANSSDVGKIFGPGNGSNANQLRTLLLNARDHGDVQPLIDWLPQTRMIRWGQVVSHAGATRSTQTMPLWGAYKQGVIYWSDRLTGGFGGERNPLCTMIQEVGHHIEHHFHHQRRRADYPPDLRGGEGALAALRICNRNVFNQLTPGQLTALQNYRDYGVISLHDPFYTIVDNVELGAWRETAIGAGIVLGLAVLPEAAAVLLAAAEVGEVTAVVAEAADLAFETEETVSAVSAGSEALESLEEVDQAEAEAEAIQEQACF